mgnify:CR=1 FL=1
MNEKINALVKRLKKGKTRYFDEFYDLTKKAVYFTAVSYTHLTLPTT